MAKKNGAAVQRTPYDPALDVIVAKLWAKKSSPTTGHRLVLRQYNGGEIKLAYEKCWLDKRSGETRAKVERCPARVLVEAGIVSDEIVAAAAEPARKSEPAAAPELEAAFEI